MSNLVKLPTFIEGQKTIQGKAAVRCVVESPMGSPTKFKYEPEIKALVMKRPLLKGLTYPLDWGFIPSTLAADDNPLDVMVVHEINHIDDISTRLRKEMEKFFVATAALEEKELAFLGWKGPKEAQSLIDEAMKRFDKKH